MRDKTNEKSKTNDFVYYDLNIVNKVISLNKIFSFTQLKLIKARKEKENVNYYN